MEEGFLVLVRPGDLTPQGHGGAGVANVGQSQTPAQQYKAAAISWLALAMQRGTFFQLENFP